MTIVKFRNICRTTIDFAPHLTLLVGDNGQGKTNTLEAIYVLLTGTSFRAAADRELMPESGPSSTNGTTSDTMRLEGLVRKDHQGMIKVSHQMSQQPQRKKHDGPVLPVVIFSPDDVQLSKGSPQGRRRFLDWLIAPIDGRYLRLFRHYHRALLQRNKALKDPHLAPTISSFTPLLAQSGTYLWERRLRVLQDVVPLAQKIFHELTGVRLDVRFVPGGVADAITEAIRYEEILNARQTEEQQKGITLIGPHRDDIIFEIDGLKAIDYASQGQHRAIALSMKLASFEILERETNMTPVVLLDDVLSELDPTKRSRLLTLIARSRPQTIVTDTEARNYENLDPIIYRVDQGLLTKQEIQ